MNTMQQQQSVYSFIGRRIRERRKLLKLNQSELATLMGFSYQQMQKYETGASQVSAGKLLLLAKIMNVAPSYFYDGFKLDDTIGKRIETNVIQKTRTEPLRMLLVDDNPNDVVLFERALQSWSEQTEIHTIHDASGVMSYLLSHGVKFNQRLPDLIILEVSMPKVNGLELLKSIKKNPKTMEIPVVILTNSVNIRDMVESYRLGAAGFIQKSMDMKEYTESMDIVVKYWLRTVALPCA